MIDRKEEEEIIKENWNRLNKLADYRIEQLKQLYGADWYEISIKDETYKMICWYLTQIKLWKRRFYGQK